MRLDSKREALRHLLATLAYRGAVAIADAPENFAEFRVHEETRTPGELLAHMGDLLEGSLHLSKGELSTLRLRRCLGTRRSRDSLRPSNS